jgi:hypothetical protein
VDAIHRALPEYNSMGAVDFVDPDTDPRQQPEVEPIDSVNYPDPQNPPEVPELVDKVPIEKLYETPNFEGPDTGPQQQPDEDSNLQDAPDPGVHDTSHDRDD